MEKKNGFNSKIGFILATAGGSVGLGNLWSFPYKTSANGGAAFVIVYIICVILFGVILSIAEMYIGKRSEANCVTAYKKINKNLGWVGFLTILISIMICCYYIVIGGYTVKYTVNSFFDNSTILESFSGNIWEVIFFTAIFLILTVIVISLGVRKGIERASKILMPLLIIIMVVIVIYCLTLGSGVSEGLNYYLNPNFKELGFDGVLAAMSQAFFSLSIGSGVLIAYGSYMKEEMKVGKAALWVALFDTIIALLGGLAIFPSIYHYKALTGIELQNNGIVLLFSSMPIVFNGLGITGKIISFFFFGMVAVAALTSVISMFEVVTQFAIQQMKIKRSLASFIIAIITFSISIPIGISLGFSINGNNLLTIGGKNLLEFFDTIVTALFIPICAFMSSLSLGWLLYKNKKEMLNPKILAFHLENDGLELGKIKIIFAFMIKYIIPIGILFIEVFGIMDILFPKIDNKRLFSIDGFIIILIGLILLASIISCYFILIKNKDDGYNKDEFKINDKKE